MIMLFILYVCIKHKKQYETYKCICYNTYFFSIYFPSNWLYFVNYITKINPEFRRFSVFVIKYELTSYSYISSRNKRCLASLANFCSTNDESKNWAMLQKRYNELEPCLIPHFDFHAVCSKYIKNFNEPVLTFYRHNTRNICW